MAPNYPLCVEEKLKRDSLKFDKSNQDVPDYEKGAKHCTIGLTAQL